MNERTISEYNQPVSQSEDLRENNERCLLVERFLELHADIECDNCKKCPLWGQNYVCASCPNSNYCAFCVASYPHESDHVFYTVPGELVKIWCLPVEISTIVVKMFTENADTRELMQRIVEIEVSKSGEDSLGDVGDRDESRADVRGEVEHPFRHLIPQAMERLSPDLPLKENVAALYEACPSSTTGTSRSPEKLMSAGTAETDFDGMLSSWVEFLEDRTETPHLLQLGVSLIRLLENPEHLDTASWQRQKDLSTLPAFLITDENDHPSFYGSGVLYCVWLLNLNESAVLDITTTAAMEEVVGSLMSPTDEIERRMTAKSFAIGDMDTVYCTPLLEMRKAQSPCIQQQCAVTRHLDRSKHMIFLFVSHAWRTRDHPDPEGVDWKAIQQFIWRAIIAVVDSIVVLKRIGIQDRFLRRLGDRSAEHEPGIKLTNAGFVTSELVFDLIKCSMEELDELQQSSEPISRDQRYVRVAKRVHIWFDYVSLPQPPRSPAETELFRFTLSNLAGLQDLMHTVMISFECGYESRAWCVAEWLNGRKISSPVIFEGEEEFYSEELPLGMRMVLKTHRAFRTLLSSEFQTSEQVLHSMDLAITNGKEDSETVCRILWEASRSVLERFSVHDMTYKYLEVADGTWQEVWEGLEKIRKEGFSSAMFNSLPAIRSQSSAKEEKKYEANDKDMTVLWFVHEPLKGENRAESFQRDIVGLSAVVSAFKLCDELAPKKISACFCQSTEVKKMKNAILCGFSCDEEICDIADIVIPMRGSSVLKRIMTNLQVFQRTRRAYVNDKENS